MSLHNRIGAFFDLDGTILPRPSLEWRFFVCLWTRQAMTSASLPAWLSPVVATFLRDGRRALQANKFYLAGLRESLLSEWLDGDAANSVRFFRAGLERLFGHLDAGHRVVVVSGTLAPLARIAVRTLPGCPDVIASELELRAGCWTGELRGEHMSGEAKARAVRSYARRHTLRLEESYAYGNEISDLPMLDSVGRPAAVNPSSRLERAARLRGWPICHWSELSPARPPAGTPRLAAKEVG